ncbi:conserved hypothetical protein [Parafrankia sp. EAN1pec]|uniref:nuclear transport factor 2 family protein n=1 Tax=Parafrankia sp. (strain EAN1pec) TaxID=298653 RepID=UPI0000542378|nr:conserved hypothetical protein [Frankia sp. EAN1pec]
MNAPRRAGDRQPPPETVIAIHDLKAHYFFNIDNHRWAELHEVFTEDARFEGFTFAGEGAALFVAGVAEFLDGTRSVHHGCMPSLRALSETRVRGRWSMHDYVTWRPGTRTFRGDCSPDLAGFHGYGYYEEEYQREPTGWRIAFMRLTRLRIDRIHSGEQDESLNALRPDFDWLPE